MVKVRFAPSPTGIPHVGNIRTALFDYFYAKSKDGTFILRIEDTDQARKVEGAVDAIKDSLTWLGAKWDEFSVQSERLDDYKKHARELIDKGFAKEEEGAVRFIVKKKGEVSWIDAIGSKKISYDLENIENFIILKADGYPTYHLANVIDDHFMGITHVIRGEDWIPSTPKHILLYKAFGWEVPVFAHVPNVMGTDGKKLSKRRGAKSVLDFKKEGYLSNALMNYLMLLGWSPKDDREILSHNEIIENFSLEKVNSSPSIFDERKLMWMNGEYTRQLSVEELSTKLLEFDSSAREGLTDEEFKKFVESAQTRMKLLAEFKTQVAPYINSVSTKTEVLARCWDTLSVLTNEEWNKTRISSQIIEFIKKEKIKFSQIYTDLTGNPSGLPLGDVFEIIGRNRTKDLLVK